MEDGETHPSNDPGAAPPSPSDLLEEEFQGLIDAFLARRRRGESPSIAEYAQKHPHLAARIERFFPPLLLLEELQPGRPEPARPHHLGKYRILRELGRGGMGVVYEAEEDVLDRRVALKVLPFEHLGEPDRLQRFRREAQAASRLQHPHIVPIHGFGEEGGMLYYAMGLIKGRSFDALLRELKAEGRCRIGPRLLAHGDRDYFRELAGLFEKLADAIEYAHSEGVLHRDVKPANLLLDDGGSPYLADFGLAKAADGTAITRAGDIVGTLRYIAPERLRGEESPAGDIYALGLCLYEFMTLEPAYPASDRIEVLRRIDSEAPLPPREIVPGIPGALESFVLKATARAPRERHATAGELARDLAGFARGGGGNGECARCAPHLRGRRFRMRMAALLLLLVVLAFLVRLLVPGSHRVPANLLAVPAKPSWVAAVDLDRDGLTDLITQNDEPGTLSVFKNEGAGRFGEPLVLNAAFPRLAAPADFDGDGLVDLATLNFGRKSFQVFLNRGKTGFAEALSQPLGEYAKALAACDLNGDGKLDLMLSGGKDRLWALLNAGDGSFREGGSGETASDPFFMIAADLDGDGNPDGVTLNMNLEFPVTVLSGDGKGHFAAPAHLHVGEPLFSIVPADFDGDGDLDLAAAGRRGITNDQSDRLWLLRNKGGGRYAEAEGIAFGGWGEDLTACDLDRDGDIDLAVVGMRSTVYLVTNDGGGDFRLAVQFQSGEGVTSVAAADLDGDGAPDLAVSNRGAGSIRLIFNPEIRRILATR